MSDVVQGDLADARLGVAAPETRVEFRGSRRTSRDDPLPGPDELQTVLPSSSAPAPVLPARHTRPSRRRISTNLR